MLWKPQEDVAGIDLGDTLITAVRVEIARNGELTLTHAGSREYDAAATDKVIAAEVRTLWRSLGIPTTSVCASLRSASLTMRRFKVPFMLHDELAAALKFKAEEALQIPVADLALDWQASPVQKNVDSAGTIEGVFVAAPIKDVDRQLAVLRQAGLLPIVLDVANMAVANAYMTLTKIEPNEHATLLVNLSGLTADMAVVVPPGWIYPYTAYCREGSWGESAAFLCESIKDLVRYSGHKLKQAPVREIVLTGQVPDGVAYAEKVAEGTGMPAEVWDPLHAGIRQSRRVRAAFQHSENKGSLLATGIGLALRRG